MDPETQGSGRKFERAAALVAVLSVAAWGLVFFLGRLDAGQRSSLESARTGLLALSQKPGTLPTPHAVQAWREHHQKLGKTADGVEEALAARDANLEKAFEEFDLRRDGGAKFRKVYKDKTDALYKRAEPIVARDSNGAPAAAAEVFAFQEWTWDPGPEEVRLALKKFWIQEAVVDVLLAAASRERDDHQGPRLLSLRVENPPAAGAPAGSVHETIPASLEALLDARDVEDVLAGILGPGKHGLLTRLAKLKVDKTEALKASYEIPVPEGETLKVRPESFLKPVKAVVAFEVVDYAAGAKPPAK